MGFLSVTFGFGYGMRAQPTHQSAGLLPSVLSLSPIGEGKTLCRPTTRYELGFAVVAPHVEFYITR
jgi:hypothetical protein